MADERVFENAVTSELLHQVVRYIRIRRLEQSVLVGKVDV